MRTFKGKKAEKGFSTAHELDLKPQHGERLRWGRSLSRVICSFFKTKEQSKPLPAQSKARLVANTVARELVHLGQSDNGLAWLNEKIFLGLGVKCGTGCNYV